MMLFLCLCVFIHFQAPILSSNVTFSRVKSRNAQEAASTEYVATALINPAKEHHTGKYVCSGTDHFDMRTYFYIYVPGEIKWNILLGRCDIMQKYL